MVLETLHPAVTAIPVGIAFGIVLERAGLGDAKVIRGQLTGTDFTVILVMFGAIVTAMLGVRWLDALQLLDVRALATPPTDVGGQVVGAIIFGGGFAIASLCPGTACVAAASGRRDGLAAAGGVLLGTLATPFLWPSVGQVVAAVPDEQRLLPADLGLPAWTVAVALVVLAGAALRLSRARAAQGARPAWWRLSTLEAISLTLAVSLAAVEGRPAAPSHEVAALAGVIEREEDHVEARTLASWIRDGRRGLRVIDVREGIDTGTYTIPGAELVPLGALASLPVEPGDLLVLYSDGGAHAAQGWVLLQMLGRRDVRVLRDGMMAWEDDIHEPILPAGDDPATRTEVERARALSLWFGGQPRVGDGTFDRATRDELRGRKRRRRTC